jgi:hypothetical protein
MQNNNLHLFSERKTAVIWLQTKHILFHSKLSSNRLLNRKKLFFFHPIVIKIVENISEDILLSFIVIYIENKRKVLLFHPIFI